MTVCHVPKHEAGGDSVGLFDLGEGRALLLVADVSGHDLKSAYLWAYFQGLLRGMVQARVAVAEILAHFNNFLVDEWGTAAEGCAGEQEVVSVSVCAVEIDSRQRSARVLNSGSPRAVQILSSGRPRACGGSGERYPVSPSVVRMLFRMLFLATVSK